MISLPPDGRDDVGGRIEAQIHGLNELVTSYLNMLSLADQPRGVAKVRYTFSTHPALARILGIPATKK